MLEASLGGDLRDDDDGAYGWVASDLRSLHDGACCNVCVVLLVGSNSDPESTAICSVQNLAGWRCTFM